MTAHSKDIREQIGNWNYPEELLEAAMTIISNATDWDLEGTDEWQSVARDWLEAYLAQLTKEEKK